MRRRRRTLSAIVRLSCSPYRTTSPPTPAGAAAFLVSFIEGAPHLFAFFFLNDPPPPEISPLPLPDALPICRGDELARRREDDRGVELLGRRSGSGPVGAERPCERLGTFVSLARHREDPPPFPHRHLRTS